MTAARISPARAAEVAPPGAVVALPPFLVEQTAHGPSWRYAQSPEFEILSRCPDSTTRDLAQISHRLHQLLQLVLPAQFQVKLDVPRIMIVYSDELLPGTSQEIIAELMRPDPALPVPPQLAAATSVSFLRNPGLFDADEMAVFISVPPGWEYAGGGFNTSDTFRMDPRPGPGSSTGFFSRWEGLTPGYVGYLLANRTPPLPSWFVAGFMGLYGQMKFSTDTITLAPAVWMSEAENRILKKDPKLARPLLPMRDFLAGNALTDDPKDTDSRREWFAQAELFLRWGLDEGNEPQREAFWRFLDRSSREPVSEAMFQECFGTNFAGVTAQLTEFLPMAVRKTARWHAKESTALPAMQFRDATGGELARIKGDWERLETNYVRAKSPELEPEYLEQARRTLRRAYNLGDRDPRLLAVLGLCECDAGNMAGAKEFLEAATQGGVIRPRAYLALARLRLDAQVASSAGQLTGAQLAQVLEPLKRRGGRRPRCPKFMSCSRKHGRTARPSRSREISPSSRKASCFSPIAPISPIARRCFTPPTACLLKPASSWPRVCNSPRMRPPASAWSNCKPRSPLLIESHRRAISSCFLPRLRKAPPDLNRRSSPLRPAGPSPAPRRAADKDSTDNPNQRGRAGGPPSP